MLMLLKSMQPGDCFIYAKRLHMVHKHELKGDQWDRTIAYNLHTGQRTTWAKWHSPNSPEFEVVTIRTERLERKMKLYPEVKIGSAVGLNTYLKVSDGLLDLNTGYVYKEEYRNWNCHYDSFRLIVTR